MKTSETLRKAAKWLEDNFEPINIKDTISSTLLCCCHAINFVEGYPFPLPFNSPNYFFEGLYKMDAIKEDHKNYVYWFGRTFSKEETNHRIMALLFAAEISEEEGD